MNEQKIHVYLAGDSTVQTYHDDKDQAGWGQFIQHYFTDRVQVHNHAIGGRSSKSFIKEGRLDEILEEIRKGDYLLIQMGHNDSTRIRPERYTEPYGDYQDYLRQYIEKARSKEAIPILITPVGRLHYVNEEFLADFGDYRNAMKEVAIEKDVPIIDLMKSSIRYFTTIGYEQTEKLFMISVNGTDCTHFTKKGANEMAKLVAEGMKKLSVQLSNEVK